MVAYLFIYVCKLIDKRCSLSSEAEALHLFKYTSDLVSSEAVIISIARLKFIERKARRIRKSISSSFLKIKMALHLKIK